MASLGEFYYSLIIRASQKAMGTNICFSTAFHPQTSGQVERVNQILEDMLRGCVISFGVKWEDCLPYAEFSYNKSFQAVRARPHSKFSMAESVVLLLIGQRLVNANFLAMT